MANHQIGAVLTLRDNMSATLRGVRREQSAFRQEAEATRRVLAARTEVRVGVANAAQAVAGIAAAAGVAGIAVGGLAVSFSDDLQKSLNGVQASTGVATEQMAGMREAMIGVYNNNFGKNFAEIGAAMALINQQTGLAGGALQKTTENALALKDAFGLEIVDSIRGANQLMKQFGMDSTAAYNLIAQGAQKGLDANGDLLDTLNEYSGTFAAQGFSAEEMFNMLSNGAATGVRDTDLLADAIKEFGIRSKDASDSSAEGFEALGLNAAEMTKAFGKGGEEGKAAFKQVTKALGEMEDPIAQNAAGTALFGTQMEDLGIKGVMALANMEGEISNTVDALGAINAVKYNTFGEAMEGIKRNLQTGLLIPIGDKLLPKMNEFATWISANMPAIQNEMSYAFNAAGAAISAAGVAIQETKTFFQNHWAIVAPILAGIAAGASAFYIITGAMKVWHGVTLLATAAQGLFNLTLAANPIGIAVIAIGLLVAAGVALWMNWDVVSAKASALWTTIENAFKKGVNGAIGLINELIETINKIPGVNIPLVAKVRLDTSENSVVEGMPTGHNAAGTDRWRGGPTWVGEEGPEIINLPRGSQVIPNHKIFGLPQVNQSEHLTQNIFKNYISGLRQERQTMASQTPPPYKREHLTQSSVTVHMNGTTIREDADVHKLANAIVLQLDLAAANM